MLLYFTNLLYNKCCQTRNELVIRRLKSAPFALKWHYVHHVIENGNFLGVYLSDPLML